MKILSIIVLFCLKLTQIDGKPQQIHLSLGANPTEMMVTFTSFSKSDLSMVRYNRIGGTVFSVNTKVTKFIDKKYEAYIHRALLTGLEPGLTYEYECGSDDKWSEKYRFKAQSNSTDSPIRVAIFGDLGLDNGVSIPQLTVDVRNGLYDSVFHIGDISYNLNKDDGSVGDQFMNKIQPFAATVPYQVCPGNHEEKRNFTHYLNRFSMIDSKTKEINNHYYSVDSGSVHFIVFSTELYFYDQYFNESHIQWQYEWLENDLKEANKPENREKRPWIITLSHRPMYCLEKGKLDCSHSESATRIGRSGKNLSLKTDYGLEDLFYRYGVDIQFYGHTHVYARSYPMYDFHIYKGDNAYDNPKAPVHIITGVGGWTFKHKIDPFPNWVAFYDKDFGFTRINVENKTHIFIEHFSVENNKIVDKFVIKKDFKSLNEIINNFS